MNEFFNRVGVGEGRGWVVAWFHTEMFWKVLLKTQKGQETYTLFSFAISNRGNKNVALEHA